MPALLFGLFISLFDALVMTVYEVPGAAVFLRVLEPLAIKIIMIGLLYGVLWLLLVYSLGRVLKPDWISLKVSLAVFIGLLYVSYEKYSTLTWGSLMQNAHTLLFISGSLLTAFVFSWAAYSVTKVFVKSKRYTFLAAVCLAVPLLLAETIGAVWVNKYLLHTLPSPLALLWSKVFTLPVLATNVVYLIVVIVTLAVFLHFRNGKGPVKVLQVFTLLVFVTSGMVLMLGSDRSLVSKTKVRTGHPVKRVILIVVDTLRADALSCYGGRRINTPHIDQFAAEGILFEKAFAPAPWTTPSMSSVLTGLSPFVHAATDFKSILPDSPLTLAERMYDEGYLTHAIGYNTVLVHRNFRQGFIGYNFFPKRQDLSPCGRVLSRLFPRRFAGTASTRNLTRLAVEWLDSNVDNDFFLWIHYFDPHEPYEPPAEYLPDNKPPPGMGKRFGAKKSVREGFLKLTGEQREWVRTLYDSEVLYVDENIGTLLDHLKKLNLYDETLIILTGDHGEEFWEHDGYAHGHTLYNELLWVPLLIKLPDSSLKTTIPRTVSIERIMPTVLELCGIKYERNCISYGSLVPVWSTSSEVNDVQPIVCTGLLFYEEKEAVIFDGFKYIHSLFTGREELYDLIDDPAERFNISRLSGTKMGQARQILTEHRKAAMTLKKIYSLEKPQEQELDVDTTRQLKSLGYIE